MIRVVAVKRVLRQVVTLAGLFNDLHEIIRVQGEQIDHVQDNTHEAKENVTAGKSDIRQVRTWGREMKRNLVRGEDHGAVAVCHCMHVFG